MRSISILGSTGSIGTQSIEVVESLGYGVSALAAGSNAELAERQARRLKPSIVAIFDEKAAAELRMRLSDTSVKVVSGMEGIIEAATEKTADTVITAVSGMIGLLPTMAAIGEKKRIALANKETLVCAGELVMLKARESGAEILPVDSEHCAIFQCLAEKPSEKELKRLILTASGGPFRGYSMEKLRKVTKEEALKHPNWNMGPKITVDSATLMNKGLEFIEAMHLFSVPPEKIGILVHPQSIIHSMVEFSDNSVLAQLGRPDMKLPIRYVLTYPERTTNPDPPLDFLSASPLTFEKADTEVFGCLALAIEAAKKGGTACAILNAANEEAVRMFLAGKISFFEIYETVLHVMENVKISPLLSVDDVLKAGEEVRDLLRTS